MKTLYLERHLLDMEMYFHRKNLFWISPCFFGTSQTYKIPHLIDITFILDSYGYFIPLNSPKLYDEHSTNIYIELIKYEMLYRFKQDHYLNPEAPRQNNKKGEAKIAPPFHNYSLSNKAAPAIPGSVIS